MNIYYWQITDLKGGGGAVHLEDQQFKIIVTALDHIRIYDFIQEHHQNTDTLRRMASSGFFMPA